MGGRWAHGATSRSLTTLLTTAMISSRLSLVRSSLCRKLNCHIVLIKIIFLFFFKDQEQYRCKSRFLYGESMGGAVALLLHKKDPSFWSGAVLVAPMCKVTNLPTG